VNFWVSSREPAPYVAPQASTLALSKLACQILQRTLNKRKKNQKKLQKRISKEANEGFTALGRNRTGNLVITSDALYHCAVA
jgi:hypothetical protein